MSKLSLNINILSKTISHALRHEPWLYELELDDQGWVFTELLLAALREERAEWSNLTEADLVQMIATSDKQRHEICNRRIRALYGHSLPGKLLKQVAEPPEVLYHGTTSGAIDTIKDQGLKPMGRQYVHLSSDADIARQVGRRKARDPAILVIQSYVAFQKGVRFYYGNDHVWLADAILPKFIEFPMI